MDYQVCTPDHRRETVALGQTRSVDEWQQPKLLMSSRPTSFLWRHPLDDQLWAGNLTVSPHNVTQGYRPNNSLMALNSPTKHGMPHSSSQDHKFGLLKYYVKTQKPILCFFIYIFVGWNVLWGKGKKINFFLLTVFVSCYNGFCTELNLWSKTNTMSYLTILRGEKMGLSIDFNIKFHKNLIKFTI